MSLRYAQDREIVIDSLQVIGELAAWRAELFVGGKHERFDQWSDIFTSVTAFGGVWAKLNIGPKGMFLLIKDALMKAVSNHRRHGLSPPLD